MTKIGVLGASGRMGTLIVREILSGAYKATLGAAVVRGSSEKLGSDAGGGVKFTSDKDAAFKACDVLIDFSLPDACTEYVALAQKHAKPLVVGTTGLPKNEEAALTSAAQKTPIFYTANMSLGVNLLMSLVEQAAAKLNAEFDIEIFEAHHKNKVDAPSGTALALGRSAAKGRGVKLEEAMTSHLSNHGPSNGARKSGTIGMSVFRGGDVVGEHTVTFAGAGERVELTHRATDRAIFAKGAVKAAVWLQGKPAGLYSMRDLLAL
jgi:4-hydroxy-tetrahydrodipicolinate reductase